MRRVIGQRAAAETASSSSCSTRGTPAARSASTPTATTSTSTRGAVALMDAWWPRFVTAAVSSRRWAGACSSMVARPGARLRRASAGTGATQVQKDLRSVLGKPERGRYSRIYCGGPRPHPSSAAGFRQARAACRAGAALDTSPPPPTRSRPSRAAPIPSQLEGPRHLRRPLDLRPDRPQHRRRRGHPAVPVAEPRHLPPDRGDHGHR